MPDDTTPHGGEAMHAPPDRARIPQPKPGRESDAPPRGQPGDEPRDRPPLPVIESGPGVADETGTVSVTQQPGS